MLHRYIRANNAYIVNPRIRPMGIFYFLDFYRGLFKGEGLKFFLVASHIPIENCIPKGMPFFVNL